MGFETIDISVYQNILTRHSVDRLKSAKNFYNTVHETPNSNLKYSK